MSRSWSIMTPKEYAERYHTFGPHRAECRMSVKNCPESIEVHVFLRSPSTSEYLTWEGSDGMLHHVKNDFTWCDFPIAWNEVRRMYKDEITQHPKQCPECWADIIDTPSV